MSIPNLIVNEPSQFPRRVRLLHGGILAAGRCAGGRFFRSAETGDFRERAFHVSREGQSRYCREDREVDSGKGEVT